jgi:hypothetical protein
MIDHPAGRDYPEETEGNAAAGRENARVWALPRHLPAGGNSKEPALSEPADMPTTSGEYRPRDRAEWIELLGGLARRGDSAPLIKRQETRFELGLSMFGEVTLRYELDGAPVRRTLPLVQASEHGIRVKSSFPMPLHARVAARAQLDEQQVLLDGHITHCTPGVSGYIVGIVLFFPDEA